MLGQSYRRSTKSSQPTTKTPPTSSLITRYSVHCQIQRDRTNRRLHYAHPTQSIIATSYWILLRLPSMAALRPFSSSSTVYHDVSCEAARVERSSGRCSLLPARGNQNHPNVSGMLRLSRALSNLIVCAGKGSSAAVMRQEARTPCRPVPGSFQGRLTSWSNASNFLLSLFFSLLFIW